LHELLVFGQALRAPNQALHLTPAAKPAGAGELGRSAEKLSDPHGEDHLPNLRIVEVAAGIVARRGDPMQLRRSLASSDC